MNEKRPITFYLSIFFFLLSIGLMIFTFYPNWKNKKMIETLQKEARPSPVITPTEEPTKSPKPEITESPEKPKEIKPYFLEQMEIYNTQDIIGYLQIPDTTIDYLVVQTTDNDFYLTRDIEKNDNIAGWIYMDYENDIEEPDRNTIIYGHNMRQDYMFHSLRKYRDEKFYKEHKYITLNTLYEETTWEIFSFYNTDIDFYYIQVFFENDEAFSQLLAEMIGKSRYPTGVEVSAEDRILTLSTCTGGSNERYVVNAKLIEVDGKPYNASENQASPVTSESPEPSPIIVP